MIRGAGDATAPEHKPYLAHEDAAYRRRPIPLDIVGEMQPVPADGDAESRLLEEIALADGRAALTEYKKRGIGGEVDARVGRWGRGDEIEALGVAAAHRAADGSVRWAAEAAVAVRARSDAVEREVIELTTGLAPVAETVTLWSHRESQRRVAEGIGYLTFRELLMMEVVLPAPPPEPRKDGALRPFIRDQDEALIAAINNDAFAGHRENDNMTVDTIVDLERQPWFDPAGLLIGEVRGAPVGFCWTKVLPDGSGEIYIIGVRTELHGTGIGRWLLLSGLENLATRHKLRTAFLWTEGDNRRAIRLYENVGFRVAGANWELSRLLGVAQPKG